MVRKHFGLDDGGITLAKIFSKLHFRMPEVIAPNESSNKTDNDGVSRSGVPIPNVCSKADLTEGRSDTVPWHGFTAHSRLYRRV